MYKKTVYCISDKLTAFTNTKDNIIYYIKKFESLFNNFPHVLRHGKKKFFLISIYFNYANSS